MGNNYVRAKAGKAFTLGKGAFFCESVDDAINLFMGLKAATEFFNDEELFDDFWGIDEYEADDIGDLLIRSPEDFDDVNKMVHDMAYRLGKAVK